VSDIRPPSLPIAPTAPGGAGRTAAQRAFFDAAMGRAGDAPVAAPAPVARQVQAQPSPQRAAQLTPDPAAEPPKKILRPGSLLDIRI
jgi:hypothetical protein